MLRSDYNLPLFNTTQPLQQKNLVVHKVVQRRERKQKTLIIN